MSGAAGTAGTSGADPVDELDRVVISPAEGTEPSAASFVTSVSLGNWFLSSSDGGGSIDAPLTDLEPPRGQSVQAFYVDGSSGDPMVLWAQLSHPSSTLVDLGDYVGIAFWTRFGSTGGHLEVFFSVQTPWSGSRDSAAPSVVVELGATWEYVEILFDDAGADNGSLASIDFVVGQGGESYEFFLDDFALLCRGTCPAT